MAGSTTIGSDDSRAPSFASAVRPRALVQAGPDTRSIFFSSAAPMEARLTLGTTRSV